MDKASALSSVWTNIEDHQTYPSLDQNIDVDIVIVGAGITGLTAAVLLQRAGKQVAVIEKDRVGAGTSSGTTAHLTTMVDSDYQTLEKSFDEKTTQRIASSMNLAIDQVEALQRELNIQCAFERVPGYYYTENHESINDIVAEFEACQRAGLSLDLLDSAPVPFSTAKVAVIQNQAQFHPLLYLRGLADGVVQGGGKIYGQTMAVDIKDGDPCFVKTDKATVTAKSIILATHTPLGINLLQTELKALRSYVLACRVDGEGPEGLFWDNAQPYHYIRRLSSEQKDIVLIGGKDHATGHGDPNASFASLEEYTRKRFPVIEVIQGWSAQFYDPADGMPYIGKSPFAQHTYLGTGYSGDGMTLGTLAGMMLSNLITKGEDPFTDLYHPGRLDFQAARSVIEENIQVAKHFVKDRVTPMHHERLHGLARGDGCVVRDKDTLVAVHRQMDGSLQACNAICPHLKCVVHWNNREKSWDCPCHGSRFSVEGSFLEGPATRGLKTISEIGGVPLHSIRQNDG